MGFNSAFKGLNETVSFLVLGCNTWWSQMLCIWRYGWWPGDYVHPELATLMKLDSIMSSWMEILIFFLDFLSHSRCWHCTLIMPWPLPFQQINHPYRSTLFSPSYWLCCKTINNTSGPHSVLILLALNVLFLESCISTGRYCSLANKQ